MRIPKKSKKSAGKNENGKSTVDKFLVPKHLDIDVSSLQAPYLSLILGKKVEFSTFKMISVGKH